MKHFTRLLLLLLVAQGVHAATPQQEVERKPGDIDNAVKQLSVVLNDRFRPNIFAEFDDGRIHRPNESKHYAATRILSLQRMGKLSVHAPIVKSAFSYEFLTALSDPTRLHEALALYQRFAVANTDDPYWRLIRARCARLMHLPETLKLYEQVAADITGVAPSEDIRKVWDANRKEFNLPAYTREAWRKQTTSFVYDAKGQDVPGSPPIKGSSLSQIDLAGTVGTDAAEWEGALGDLGNASAKQLDKLYGETKKYAKLPWLDGRGFMNTEQVLNGHLLSMPDADLKNLRQVQESGYLAAAAKAAGSGDSLVLFRRYPWSASAQSALLKSAQRDIFEGKPQSAYRSFQDVLLHAEAKDLREQAQVGLWFSLSQFAERDVLAKAFDGIDADTTWPWNGKREKTAVIQAALTKQPADQVSPPTLDSLKAHIVQLPPAPPAATNQLAFEVNLQRRGNRLLISSDGQMVMYDAAKPKKPIWSHTQRVAIPSGNKPAPGAPFRGAGARMIIPLLSDDYVTSTWGGTYPSARPVVMFRQSDGALMHTADPHGPQSRFRYRTTSSPVAADGRIFATQMKQPYNSIYGHPEYRGCGEVALSCFEGNELSHRWTRTYEVAQINMIASLSRFKAVVPRVSGGAVYVCTNDGHVIRADARDGELEWIHYFRPQTNDSYSLPASPRCLGSRPIVTDDKVICMPKFTGFLFALDRKTGRRIWRTPILRGHQVLGVYDDKVVIVGANALCAVDLGTGKLSWGRSIADNYADGFQLPRAQMIGSSIYCGTKNALYQFDASSGALLESREWAMESQVPMTFLISGSDLFVVSDLPMKDEVYEKQLVDYHTVVYPAGEHREQARPVDLKDGSKLLWRDSMLMCIKGDKLLWSRFVSNEKVYQSRFTESGGKISMTWSVGRSGTSAVYDSATGQLLSLHQSRAPEPIIIGAKK